MEKITSFAHLDLHPNIAKALKACGYENPTPIQSRSIPEILEGKDLVASAQTGTGKTAAFVLPALQRLCEGKPQSKPRVLILTPTRELAAQITDAAGRYGKFMQCNIVSLVGGMPYRQQLRQLSRPVDMIVATPGRLLDHLENKKVDLSHIEMLILDEADRMLDMGFIDDVKHIAKKITQEHQTLLFSATVDSKLTGIIKQLLKNPVRIDLSEQIVSPHLITQVLYWADNIQHKNRLLQHFLDNENIYKAIIFSATKIHADQLANELSDQGYAAAALHGDLKQSVRSRTVEKLRNGKIQYLVATDVAARGIDISDVTHVINYDLPKFSEDYVHRIGRTGRAGKSGIAISFGSPMDRKHLERIERYIGKRIDVLTIPGLEPTKGAKKSKAFADKKSHHSEPRGKKSFRDGDKKSDRRKSFSTKSKERDDSREFQPSRKQSPKFNRDYPTKQEKGDGAKRFASEFKGKGGKHNASSKFKSKYETQDDSRFSFESKGKSGKHNASSKFKSKHEKQDDSRFSFEPKGKSGKHNASSKFKSRYEKQDDSRFASEYKGKHGKQNASSPYKSEFKGKSGKSSPYSSEFKDKRGKQGGGKYSSEFKSKHDKYFDAPKSELKGKGKSSKHGGKSFADSKYRDEFEPKREKQHAASQGTYKKKPTHSAKSSSHRGKPFRGKSSGTSAGSRKRSSGRS